MKRCEKVFYTIETIIVIIVSIMFFLIIKSSIATDLLTKIIEGIFLLSLGIIASSLNIALLAKSKEK